MNANVHFVTLPSWGRFRQSKQGMKQFRFCQGTVALYKKVLMYLINFWCRENRK